MHHAERLPLQLLLQVGQPELAVQQLVPAVKLLDAPHLVHHVRQPRKSLHRLGEPHRQEPRLLPSHRLRIGQAKPRRYGNGVAVDQEPVAVMQRGHGDGPQGPVGDENQGVDLHRVEVLLQGPDQPVVQLLGVGEEFPGGALDQLAPELPDLAGQLVHPHRQREALQPAPETHQEFHAVGQQDGVDHHRLLGDQVQFLLHAPGRVDAVVTEVFAQFEHLQGLKGFPRLHQVRLDHPVVLETGSALQEQVDQLEADHTRRLLIGGVRARVTGRHLLPDRLQVLQRQAVRRDGLVESLHPGQDAAALPLPAVKRFRDVQLLSCEDGLPREFERLVVPVFILIQLAEVAVGVG